MAIRIEKDGDGIATLILDMADRSSNVLCPELMAPFEDAVSRLKADTDVTGVILTSAKRDFLAGADLVHLYGLNDREVAMAEIESFKAVLRRLETLGKPVVAAINGTALGGGYEVALACHHRVALDDPKSRIGLPEVTLGLFPGGGGTQRLPRMIGIQRALPILLEGKSYPPRRALKEGLVDAVATSRDEMMAAARAWIAAHPDAVQPWDTNGFRWPGGNSPHPKNVEMFSIAPAMLYAKTRGNYPGPRAALSCVYEGGSLDFDTACRVESRYFAKVVTHPVAKNMITAFWFQLNQIRRGGSRPADVPVRPFEKVGVLGAGLMGAGIAGVSAGAGLDVVLKDVSLARAEEGKAHTARLLDKDVARGRKSAESRQAVLDRIQPAERADDLAGCDLIIEAVFEDRELKAKVTAEAEAAIGADAVFGSNTSTLPITGLAARSARPANFIGIHFFSPVEKMRLVEVIVGRETSDETLARAFDFVLQIGKTPIVVNDSRGFYTSRVFSTYVMEGMALLAEGQHPRAIEAAGLKAGMPVGPLALSDEVSIGLMHRIQSQTRKDLAAEGREPDVHPGEGVVEKMAVDLERPGKRAGRGFYDYPTGGTKHLWPGLAEVFPVAEAPMSQRGMIDRMLFAQALETVRCLDEGVVTSVADANIGSIFGWGFAPSQGGTLQFINSYGLDRFIARAEGLAKKFGARFSPPDRLRHMAEANETF